jgi:hypothetical protein
MYPDPLLSLCVLYYSVYRGVPVTHARVCVPLPRSGLPSMTVLVVLTCSHPCVYSSVPIPTPYLASRRCASIRWFTVALTSGLPVASS